MILVGFSLWGLIRHRRGQGDMPDWALGTWLILWWLILPGAAFALFPSLPSLDAPAWGLVLAVALAWGFASGFFGYDDVRAVYGGFIRQNLRWQGHKHLIFLAGIWLLGGGPAVLAWLLGPAGPHELDAKLDMLAMFLIAMPAVFSGLPVYPLLALAALGQARPGFASRLQEAEELWPLRWQSFAYPLPGFYPLLRRLAVEQGVDVMFYLLQRIQLESLQQAGAARGALKLADDPGWALPFCGTVAWRTNPATAAPLALAGEAGRAVAVLLRRRDREDDQPLRLWFGAYPPPPPVFSRFQRPGLAGDSAPSEPGPPELKEFEKIRAQPLAARLAYALARLEHLTDHAGLAEYRALLRALLPAARAGSLPALADWAENLPEETWPDESRPERDWLGMGWAMLAPFRQFAGQLPEYRQYHSAESRRDFLNHLLEQLQEADDELLEKQAGKTAGDRDRYLEKDGGLWANIALELIEGWRELLTAESRQAREWLRLEAEVPPQALHTGHQVLAITVRNPGGVTARRLTLRVLEIAPALHCDAPEIHINAPLEPGQAISLNLTFSCEQAGEYVLRGEVEGVDFAGEIARVPFSERLDIGRPGRPYVLQKANPYVVGEGLSDDRTFVERGELRHRIQSLWRQAGGKPAVLLVGQRRIGKSTLLNKMERDGLEDCGLWPVRLDMQGCNTPWDLFQEAACGLARHLGQPAPRLDKAQPFADFKDFLRDPGWPQGRRGLLMLDEAERVWLRLGGDTPDNLRALMQGPEYPLLLLFCGTHALQRLGRDYGSVLFNTAHAFTLGYMSEHEAREVLEKPAHGILEYDSQALAEAWRLTRGQPYLLQLLGSTLIQRFDSATLKGEPRGDYVSLRDLQLAADTLARRDNPAFENYWRDADADTRKLFAALARATDELDRPQLDLEGIAAALRQWRMPLSRERLFECLEALSEEELLTNLGPAYRFSVPLFRRWLAHRWPPDKARMATQGG